MIANAISFFIICCIPLILLASMAEEKVVNFSEGFASGIGLIGVMLFVTFAVVLLILSGLKMKDFEKWEEEDLDTAYGVTGLVKEIKNNFQKEFQRNLVLGIAICILSIIPLFMAISYNEENDFLMVIAVCIMLILIAVGVNLIIRVTYFQDKLNVLLQEENYTFEKKKANKIFSKITSIYWLSILAIYLFTGFYFTSWPQNWLIWPIAGIVFGIVAIIVELVETRKNRP